MRRWEALDGLQPAIVPEEYPEVERMIKAEPRVPGRARAPRDRPISTWSASTRSRPARGRPPVRGPTPLPRCRLGPAYPDGNPYARPIEGVFGLVDLQRGEVLEVDDHGVVPLPTATASTAPRGVGPMRDDLKPLEIDQPEGPSFTVDGQRRALAEVAVPRRLHPAEGLVLHTRRLRGRRPRAPDPPPRVATRRWSCPTATRPEHVPPQNAFDIGEYGVGPLANSLDARLRLPRRDPLLRRAWSTTARRARAIPNAICLHEEDYGILWKHTDYRTGQTEVRRSRRLVISFVATVGNYDYGFYWYLYQDGTIECEVKLTGIISTGAVAPARRRATAQLVAPRAQRAEPPALLQRAARHRRRRARQHRLRGRHAEPTPAARTTRTATPSCRATHAPAREPRRQR